VKSPEIAYYITLLDLGITNVVDTLIYKFLVLRKKYRQPITVDAVALQKRINKLCKRFGICDRTAIRALKRLAKAGLINFVYDIRGFGKYVVEVIPLHEFAEHTDPNQTDVSDVVVAESDCHTKDTDKKTLKNAVDQQQLINADKLCRSAGVIFQRRNLWAIAKYPMDAIKRAIDHYRFARRRNDIPSPTGWLLRNLQYKWYLSHNAAKAADSLTDKYFELQDMNIDAVGAIPTKANQLPLFSKKMGDPKNN